MIDRMRMEAIRNQEPSPDLGKCSDCGKTFKLSECPTETDGDWETGYYEAPVCPKCPDGGCIAFVIRKPPITEEDLCLK